MHMNKDFYSGLMFCAFGVAGLWISSGYRLGVLSNMGPGFFPMAISGLIAFVGIVTAARGFLSGDGDDEPIRMRAGPIGLILLSIIAFGLLIDRFGLIAATMPLVIASYFAVENSRPWESAVILAVLVLIASAIFIWGLGMPLRLLPR